MNAQKPDVEGVLQDFRGCLNTFDEWAESFWSGSALEVEQVFKVGNEVALVAPVSSKTPSSAVAECRAQGSITLAHIFQSTQSVPIGNTPVMLQAIAADGSPLGSPIHKTIGPSGILEVKECTRDQKYKITFYPDVSKDHVKALYASYQSVVEGLEADLRDEWSKTFKAQWSDFAKATPLERSALQGVAFASGIAKALYNLWDNVAQLYDLLADIQANSEKLLQYISEAELDQLLKLGHEAIAQGLLVLSDEPLLFIYLSAMIAWIRMLPPPDLYELLGEITGEVLINLFLIWATRGMGVQLRLGAQVMSHVKSGNARRWLKLLATHLVGPKLETHVEAAKPLLLGSPATAIKTVPAVSLKVGDQLVSNPVPAVRNKSQKTALVRQEHVDDAPASARNPNGDAAASSDKTVTNGCPVSMVTGEELLTLTDGTLDGVLPFEWTRLYRTSAVEVDCGLGFGWSHSLAQRLSVSGDSVVWTDHENRSTQFPMPSSTRPAITNSLAEAAIYLGSSADELVLAQASRFYHFRDGVLTAISDAYDNRDQSKSLEKPRKGYIPGAKKHYPFRKKMKHWNELDGSIFFGKIFSQPISIGRIALFSLRIDNDQPCIGLGFDIPQFPDNLPEKWKNKGYNTCRIGITCHEIKDLKIHNIPVHEVFIIKIEKHDNYFKLQATSESASIEFQAKFISLSDPNVYINGPDDYYFK